MNITHYDVSATSLSTTENLPVIIAGSVSTHGVHFTFTDNIWEHLTPTVTFHTLVPYQGEVATVSIAILDKNATYVVPPEIMATANASIKLDMLGIDTTGTTVVPTLCATYVNYVSGSSANNIIDTSNRTPSVYEQWLQRLDTCTQTATETAKASADEATEQAHDASESATAALASASESSNNASMAQQYQMNAMTSASNAANSASEAQNTATENIAQVTTIAAQAAQSAENAAETLTDVTQVQTEIQQTATEVTTTKLATQAIADTVEAIVAGNEAYTKEETYAKSETLSTAECRSQFARGVWLKKSGQTVECCPTDGSMLEITMYGNTTQDGEGDPSPENIRTIHGVGRYDKKVVLDGTEAWSTADTSGSTTYPAFRLLALPYVVNKKASETACAQCNIGITTSGSNGFSGAAPKNSVALFKQGTISLLCFYNVAQQSVADWKNYLATAYAANTPVTIWYQSTEYETATQFYTGFSITDPKGQYHRYDVTLPEGTQLYGDDTTSVYDFFEPCVMVDETLKSRLTQHFYFSKNLSGFTVSDDTNANGFRFATNRAIPYSPAIPICNICKNGDVEHSTTCCVGFGTYNGNQKELRFVFPSEITTTDQAQAYILSHDIEILYQLSEPTVTLDTPISLCDLSQENKYSCNNTTICFSESSNDVGYNLNLRTLIDF